MDTDELVAEYLTGLAAADIDRVLVLFAPGAVVNSPLYGSLPATDFYTTLFGDTAESRLTLRTTMTGEFAGRQVISFWFEFEWVLAGGERTMFTVVDVAQLDANGRIKSLDIVYDTAPLREAFNRRRL